MPGPSDDRKPTSWTARVLAPVLLVVVAAAIALVISGSLSSDDGSEDQGGKGQTAATPCADADEDVIKDGYYVVQEGDNFTTIAERSCVSEERLQELNPNLDPFGLQVQNCVDLVPDGCKKLSSG
jgi:hypothetical protein